MPGTIGNQNARRAKECRDALKYVLDNFENSAIKKGQALRGLANKLVEMALDGNLAAIKEVGDRLDGRPAQAIIGEDGGPLQAAITVSFKGADNGKTH